MKITTKRVAVLCSLMLSVSTFAQFTQQSKLVSPERGSRDEFGTSVDIRGDFAISGTPRYDIAAGAAYIYAKDVNGNWSHHQSLIPDDSKPMAEFGGAVKMTEDYIVIASGRADIDQTIRAGALYVYGQDGTTWNFSTKIIASDYSNDAMMGMNLTSLDAEDNIIVAGAPGENVWTGSVYVFEKTDDVWSEVQKIVSPSPEEISSFGIGVAISGNTLVIGANEVNNFIGAVYIYTKNANGQWIFSQEITATDGISGDYFGSSVSIDDETIVVGAYGVEGVKGAAYVFKKDDTGIWEEVQKLTASTSVPDAHFGFQCEVKGANLVVGAPHAWAFTLGEVFLFQENTSGQWEETQIIQSNDIAVANFFGWSVALYEDQIIAGAPWENTDEDGNNPIDESGSAYIFKNPTLKTSDFSKNEASLVCYPNPTEGILTIASTNNGIKNVKVIGVTGLLLKEYDEVNTMDFILDIQHYSNGVYMVSIEFEDGSKSIQKVIKR